MSANAQAEANEVGRALSDNMKQVEEVRQEVENNFAN